MASPRHASNATRRGSGCRAGLDPNIEKKAERARVARQQGDSFAKLAEEWFAKQSAEWSKRHADARRRLLDRDLIKPLGAVPIADLEASPATALAALQRVEARGAHEVASKARIVGSMICRYGIVTGRMKHDPFAHLGDALKRPPVTNRATIPLKEMPALFKALAAVPAELNTRLAFYWLLLTAARTSEMRFATWGEIEDGKLWRVPRRAHEDATAARCPALAASASDAQARAGNPHRRPTPTPCSFPASRATARYRKTPCSPCSPAPATSAGRPSHGFRASVFNMGA